MPETLHGTVQALAGTAGDAVALIHGDRRLTYRELDRAATTYAAHLTKYEVGRGDVVPLLLPRGIELICAMLGVLKTGAAYANLDPTWPDTRIGDVLDQLRPKVAVTAGARRMPAPVWQALPAAEAALDTPTLAPVPVTGTDPACVFFTSGTTGRPKGVLSPHQATLRLFGPDSFARFDTNTVIPVAAPTAWDGFSLEIWAALLSGGTALLVEEPFLTPQALRDGARRHGVNTVWLTSGLFNAIVDEDLDALTGIGQVMIGGERLSPPHVARFLAAHPGTLLLNGYGPVESTVFATTHRITPADCDRPGGIPIGRPVPRTSVYLLDGDREAPPGEPGELCIGGDGLAVEYAGLPAQTAEKFPTLRLGGATVRVYRTGDIAVRDDDGLLHYRGRADRQVKIRGHRIEPAEVERQIEACLPVRRCVVIARRDDHGTVQDLAAFCIPTTPGDPLPGAAGILADRLVAYHRPAVIHSVDSLPLTANGKLDERALLALTRPEPAEPGPVTPPTDALTRLVAEVFADVLGRTAVDARTGFTDLGGSSLAAVRVCARLSTQLERPVPVSALYDHPTADSLAEHLRTTTEGYGEGGADVPRELPLSAAESSFLTQHLLHPDSLAGHCLGTWIVTGEVDHEALRQAVADVHDRHPALHAHYGHGRRGLYRTADRTGVPPMTTLPSAADVAGAVAAARAELSRPLAVTAGEVWRTVAAPVTGTATTVLAYAVHHVAFDGWSESVLADDLATAYRARAHGDQPQWPPVADLGRLHTIRTAHRAAAGTGDQLRRRIDGLNGLPELQVPAGAESGGPAQVTRELSAATVHALTAAADHHGQSLFQLLLWLYGRALAECTGQRDFGIGVPVAQRVDARIEHMVGCFITMACVRLHGRALGPDGAATAGRLIQDAMRDVDVSIPELVRALNPPRSGRAPLFQTIFALQNNTTPHMDLTPAQATFLRQPYLGIPTELQAEVWPHDDGLRLVITTDRAAVADDFAATLADTFTALATALPPTS
ncbi:amino acid adenylation protein [Actinoplanes lobatus]|uniref:Amino acid adenylation domain-containing protein n=1 Tax=Actinoplanes lobatus TaxID=113568 RepID=A0A7W7HKM4_9ACTN|nr:non-ribosomal peptide synthetase [Actinoplanes lobatus]MBB4751942.1 amino acid adenylation domain-containing protein [Actinoplanes lobatus]GGN85418.1 amino acid adenylation protein [Actinoplanes lobatus]GIE44331.1 amino acid adenylation protein [Actinoplanes lobatus]